MNRQINEQEEDEHEKDDPEAYRLSFTQIRKQKEPSISKDWLLLDSQSSISVFNNEKFLKNIRRSNLPITVHTNGEKQE